MFELFLSVIVKGVGVKEETIFLSTKTVAFSVLATLPIMLFLNFMGNSVFSIAGMLYSSSKGASDETVDELIKEFDDEDGSEMQCAVCLNEVCKGEKVKILPRCKHGYHVSCIDSWLQTNPSCPICRSEVKVKSISQACRFKVLASLCASFLKGFCKSFLGLSTDSIGDGHYFY